ncbi:MAG: hemerythrin domain-containing protein [Alphaproteobacteria bacterium]
MVDIDHTPDVTTGVAILDRDHDLLADMVRYVATVAEIEGQHNNIGSALNSLVDWAEHHFVREERILEAVHSPGLATHATVHRKLEAQIKVLRDRFLGQTGELDPRAIARQLQEWLVNHIERWDVPMFRVLDHNSSIFERAGDLDFMNSCVIGGDMRLPKVSWQDMRVLVVDDDRWFLELVGMLLRPLDVGRVRMADSGPAGLEMLRRETADLVLCDWHMEGMEATAFLAALRTLDPAAKAILISEPEEAPGTRQRMLVVGADDCLVKPITARGIIGAIAGMLER